MSYTNLGPFRVRHTGDFDPLKKYRYLDVVNYTDGNSYVCINEDTVHGAVYCVGIDPIGAVNSHLFWDIYNRKGDKGDLADKYDSFLRLDSDNWNYMDSDKVVIDEGLNLSLNITNVYDGCCGMIISRDNLNLPENSDFSADFYFMDVIETTQYYLYTFVYIEALNKFIWNRTVING